VRVATQYASTPLLPVGAPAPHAAEQSRRNGATENAGLELKGPSSRTGKYRTGMKRTKSQGWKMQDWN